MFEPVYHITLASPGSGEIAIDASQLIHLLQDY